MLLSEDKNKSQYEISNSAKSDNECRDSQLVRPKWLVANNKIVHVTQGKAFNVMNENDEPYLVRIFPKPSCTCKSQQTKCCHIIAVLLSLGIEVKNSMSLPNLTKLRRNMQNGQKQGAKCVDTKSINYRSNFKKNFISLILEIQNQWHHFSRIMRKVKWKLTLKQKAMVLKIQKAI